MAHAHETNVARVDEYLESIRAMQIDSRDLEWRIRDLRERLQGLGAPSGRGGGASSSDRLAKGIAALEELEHEWSSKVAGYAKEIARAIEVCNPSRLNRYVVWLRKVERLTWSEVAQRINYSIRTAQAMVESGYAEIFDDMPSEWKMLPLANGGDEWHPDPYNRFL